MFLLFGTALRERVLTIVSFVCHFCGKDASQEVVEQSTKFSLFFIPLFTISRRHFVACSNCGGMTALTRQQANNGIEWAQRNRQMQ